VDDLEFTRMGGKRGFMSSHKYYEYICPACGSGVRKKLCEDYPGGHHIYVYACGGCLREFGDEWAECLNLTHFGCASPRYCSLLGAGEAPPALNLRQWPALEDAA
jgi:hypothetical protein